MTAATISPTTAPAPNWKAYVTGRNGVVLFTVLGIAIMSVARLLADADRLTSSTTVGVGLRLAIPIALAGIGGLYAERSGTVNIGLEGIMTLGTVMAGWAGWHWGPWAALVGGVVGGIAGGLLMSLATTTFGVNHIIAGFAMNIIGPGVARFLANVWFTTEAAKAENGSITSSPATDGKLPSFSLPVLSDGPDLLGDLEKKGWFFVSDLAGFLRGVTVDIRADTILAVLLIILSAYVIWRTPFGLRLRSAGEKPGAAESLGVSVVVMRHVGMIISGAFGGLAGAVLIFAGSRQYQENQVAGRGFLGLAALVFGNWRPGGVLAGAGVFGYADGMRTGLDPGVTVRALVLAAAIALALYAVYAVSKRAWIGAGVSGGVAVLGLITYLAVDEINDQFVYITPYVVTIVVVTVFATRLRPPAAEGIPYFKGQQL